MIGESTSRETAIAAMAEAANAHISDREHTFDGKPTGWRVCACGAIDKDGTHRTAMTWDALLASGRVIPIEEHEAALAQLWEAQKADLDYWQDRTHAAELKVARLRDALELFLLTACDPRHYDTDPGPYAAPSSWTVQRARAALADTQHPSPLAGVAHMQPPAEQARVAHLRDALMVVQRHALTEGGDDNMRLMEVAMICSRELLADEPDAADTQHPSTPGGTDDVSRA